MRFFRLKKWKSLIIKRKARFLLTRRIIEIQQNMFKECMLKAINLGDDTDTVAAIAGGLAGLYYGYEEIPKDWLAVIKKREWIEGMCEGLE